MRSFNKYANGLMILAFVLLLISIVVGMGNQGSIAADGAADVRNIAERQAERLNGTWEFYWGQLLPPDGSTAGLHDRQLVHVPNSWTRYRDNAGKTLPVDGTAVYRILVRGNIGDYLAIKLPQIGSSYNLWIDGKNRFSSGRPGPNAAVTVPAWNVKVVNFQVEKEQTEILLEVANFHYFRAGITTPVLIGTESQIQQIKYRNLFTDTFIFSSLFVMAFFFILVFIVHSRKKSHVYLALFSLAVSIRPLLYGECFFNNLFPGIHFELNTKLYLVAFVILQLFILYFYYQYEGLINSRFLYLLGWPILLAIAAGCVLPVKYMQYPVVFLEALVPFVVLACMYMMYKAYKNKHPGVSVNVLCLLLLSFLSVIDILNNSRVIELNIYYTPIAMLIVTFIQAFLQLGYFRENARLTEKLALEVDMKNLKLDYEIRQRDITEKLNSGLKALVATMDIQELLEGLIDNLYQIVPVDSAIIVLNINRNLNYIARKLSGGEVSCFRYEHEINLKRTEAKDGEATLEERRKIQLRPLYKIQGQEKYLIVKPLYYKSRLISILKMTVKGGLSNPADNLELIDIFCEQAILALQNVISYERIKELAMYDELTALYNRRYLMKLGSQDFISARKDGSGYGVIMLDIDNFKSVNDTYGHLFGDKIIKGIADTCKKCISRPSVIGRYGGEEFVVFLTNTRLEDVLDQAEQLRQEIGEAQYAPEGSPDIRVTASIGISMRQNLEESLQEVIHRADQALYMAKSSGKNRISYFPELPERVGL